MSDLRCNFLRAGRVESVHRVSLAALENGKAVYVRGQVDEPVFMRSCAKLFQALTVVESGAADAYGFTPEEIAVIAGSHPGEADHVRAVTSILKKAKIAPAALKCGIHMPSGPKPARELIRSGKEATVLHNNCSGKHSGMVAAAKFMRAPLESYLKPSHPLQKAIRRNVERFTGIPASKIPLGVDGCSAPTFAVPLRALAKAVASFCETPGTPRRVRDAMMAHPAMVGRPCATIMAVAPGRLVAKAGAEGVYILGFPGRNAALALKVEDGNVRAWLPVLHAVVSRLGWLEKPDLSRLGLAVSSVLKNHAGLKVGEIQVVL
jgi:L-asparaginase II